MRYNKFKAFTIAEIMVILLTLSILLAAFAPVFTRRYNNVTSNEVWTYVPGDDNYNAYFDTPNKLFLNQAFVGLTPISSDEVRSFSGGDSCEVCITNLTTGAVTCASASCSAAAASPKPIYSKLVIAASKELGSITNDPPQNQMQFRMATSNTDAAGTVVGSLFAGNNNMLLGGPYVDIKNDAVANSAFGAGSLKSLTKGDANTAVGYNALNKVTTGNANTAIGVSAGDSITSGSANTFVGHLSGENTKGSVSYNTVVGRLAGRKIAGSGNTAVGNSALTKGAGDGNTAVGNSALTSATGKYNTAVGHSALAKMVKGNYNTAIGASSCLFIGEDREISKVTCVGSGSGAQDQSALDGSPGLPTGSGDNNDVPDRVFLGRFPNDSTLTQNAQKPFAVLEVHNSINAPLSTMEPYSAGEESVIINGNLVVRGMTYLETPIYRTVQSTDFKPNSAPKGLVLYKAIKKYQTSGAEFNVFAGWDGTDRQGSSHAHCRNCSKITFEDVRPNCICTAVGPGYTGHTNYKADSSVRYSSTSYDWYTKANHHNDIEFTDYDKTKYGGTCKNGDEGNTVTSRYTDLSTGQSIELSRKVHGDSSVGSKRIWGSRETDRPYAHMPGKMHACCPKLDGVDVPSDIRLKNVGEKFTAGLDEIKKLRPYHFTFKNDVNKLPQVGVIAQDLKVIFPTAVEQNEDGYYQIRWEEMFYAAINAVKTLNSRIEALASKIATDKDRIAALKRDNAAMYAQLDKLVDELEDLEAKKK